MGSITDYAENALMNHVLGGSAYTPVATLYLALCTADPTDAATGASMNEAANANNYARTAIAFGAAGSRLITQNADAVFNQASGAWGDLTHWAICDSGTYGAGNVLAAGALSATRSPVSGNTPTVPSGEIYVQVSAGAMSTYLANALLDRMFRNQAYAQPATYVALTTATISDTSTGSTITEPGGNGYARVLVNVIGGASPAWAAVSGGASSNANDITIGPPSGSWGTIVALGIVDAASVGNLLFYDNTNVVDQAVGADDTVTVGSGDLDVSLS